VVSYVTGVLGQGALIGAGTPPELDWRRLLGEAGLTEPRAEALLRAAIINPTFETLNDALSAAKSSGAASLTFAHAKVKHATLVRQ
jgi:hypothetical protein